MSLGFSYVAIWYTVSWPADDIFAKFNLRRKYSGKFVLSLWKTWKTQGNLLHWFGSNPVVLFLIVRVMYMYPDSKNSNIIFELVILLEQCNL